MAERYLPAKADQQLDAQGTQDGVADGVTDAEPVLVGKVGDAYEKKQCQQDHFALDELGLPPGMVLGIILMIDTARKKRC